MKKLIESYIKNKKILIAGFGKEGRSTLRYLAAHFPGQKPAVADQNVALEVSEEEKQAVSEFILGKDYLKSALNFDVIIKSPGIDLKGDAQILKNATIISQTSLFLEKFHSQIIGITGSKGKSTTSSLVYHILKEAGKNSIFVGNIGQPSLDLCNIVDEKTTIVFELSAHQLEFVSHSPHIAVLLNIFQEHLDYFKTFEKYANAKLNILKFQQDNDYFALPDHNRIPDIAGIKPVTHGKQVTLSMVAGDFDFYLENQQYVVEQTVGQRIDISGNRLFGNHNLRNILTAVAVCRLAGVERDAVGRAVSTFQPLEHRLEFVGNFGGIDFFNDSISTIPEATIQAVNTITKAETLIIGGFDRGINYDDLVIFLSTSHIRNFIFTGPAGKRIMQMFEPIKTRDQRLFFIKNFGELGNIIKTATTPGKACLLSPAASSYDEFKNFEERGLVYKKIARNL